MILEASACTEQRFMSEKYWTSSRPTCVLLLHTHFAENVLLASSCSVFELIKILQHKDWIYQSGSNGNKDSKIPIVQWGLCDVLSRPTFLYIN